MIWIFYSFTSVQINQIHYSLFWTNSSKKHGFVTTVKESRKVNSSSYSALMHRFSLYRFGQIFKLQLSLILLYAIITFGKLGNNLGIFLNWRWKSLKFPVQSLMFEVYKLLTDRYEILEHVFHLFFLFKNTFYSFMFLQF